jgi:hypothetical protein
MSGRTRVDCVSYVEDVGRGKAEKMLTSFKDGFWRCWAVLISYRSGKRSSGITDKRLQVQIVTMCVTRRLDGCGPCSARMERDQPDRRVDAPVRPRLSQSHVPTARNTNSFELLRPKRS